MAPDHEVREWVARIETLLGEVEAIADPGARGVALEAVQLLVRLYGEGLERMLGIAGRVGGDEWADAVAADEVVSHLLLIHGLHPVGVADRVAAALDEVRPYLRSHGGDVVLLEIDDARVRLRLQGSCSGCPSSTATVRAVVEEAIRLRAPELERIEVEGVAEPVAGFVPVAALGRRGAGDGASGRPALAREAP